MEKTFKVVMLPTNEKISLLKLNTLSGKISLVNKGIDLTLYKPQCLYIISDDEIKEGDWFYHEFTGHIRQAIKITNGNIFIGLNDVKSNYIQEASKKIVATTDSSIQALVLKLGLASIPESFIQAFIKAYNEGKPITEVDLEVTKEHFERCACRDDWTNCLCNTKVTVKTKSDNTVIVREKKMYSRDELEKAFDAGKELVDYDWHMNEFHGPSCGCKPLKYTNFNEWIEENL